MREKERTIFLISVIFHIRRIPCLLKPSLRTRASPYFNFVYFRQCKRHWDTFSLLILVIMINKSRFSGDLNQVSFNRILAPPVGAKDGALTLRIVTGAFQKILWEQVVTCSALSKKHFETNLTQYWRVGRSARSVSYTHLTLPTS